MQDSTLSYHHITKGEGTTARSKERKKDKSEDNSDGVAVLLKKMNIAEIDRGSLQVFFLALSYYFNLVNLVEMDV